MQCVHINSSVPRGAQHSIPDGASCAHSVFRARFVFFLCSVRRLFCALLKGVLIRFHRTCAAIESRAIPKTQLLFGFDFNRQTWRRNASDGTKTNQIRYCAHTDISSLHCRVHQRNSLAPFDASNCQRPNSVHPFWHFSFLLLRLRCVLLLRVLFFGCV